MATDASGNFVIVWESYHEGDRRGIFGRRYDATGTATINDFLVNTYTPDRQDRAAIAVAPAGHFVVVWVSYRQDGDVREIFGQRFAVAP